MLFPGRLISGKIAQTLTLTGTGAQEVIAFKRVCITLTRLTFLIRGTMYSVTVTSHLTIKQHMTTVNAYKIFNLFFEGTEQLQLAVINLLKWLPVVHFTAFTARIQDVNIQQYSNRLIKWNR